MRRTQTRSPLGLKTGCDGRIPPRHASDVPGGSLRIRHFICSQQRLHNHMHQFSATDGMDELNQVLLNVLRNTNGHDERPCTHVASGTGVRDHF